MKAKNLIKRLVLEEQIKDEIRSKYQILSETSLQRILKHYSGDGLIIISADRMCESEKGRECTEEELLQQVKINKQNEKEIQKDLRAAKYGFIPAYGGYKEKVTDKDGNESVVDSPTPEKSFIIPAKDGYSDKRGSYDKLFQLGIQLIKKYNQDSFLAKPPDDVDKKAYWIDKEGNITNTFDSFTLNNLSQPFFSQARKGNPNRRITLTENQEIVYYIPKPPKSGAEAWSRYGEFFWRIKT